MQPCQITFNRYAYPLTKFLVSIWMIPLIQICARVLASDRDALAKQRVVIVTSRSEYPSPSFACLIPALEDQAIDVVLHTFDYSKFGFIGKVGCIFRFFAASQDAKFVFLDDTFLPIAYASRWKWLWKPSIVQLWHSAGLFKKVGLDLHPRGILRWLMKINFRNFDLVTVSSEACRDAIAGFMGLDKAKVVALGTSYTDRYFDANDTLGQARRSGRKTLIYAPTYRGDAFNVSASPVPEMKRILPGLKSDFQCFICPHPHDPADPGAYVCPFSLATSLKAIDVLVTDYSSIAMDYLLANPDGKLVLFVPDLETFSETNGFYVSPDEVTPLLARNEAEFLDALNSCNGHVHSAYREEYLTMCDGEATGRLIDYLGMTSK